MISDIDKSCASKSFFKSKSGAKKAARHFAGVGVYKCRHCSGYHMFQKTGTTSNSTHEARIPNNCKRAGVRSNRRPRVEYEEDDA